MGCTRPSRSRPTANAAPAAAAMSPSPVASTTAPAWITSGPDFVSNTTPRPSPVTSVTPLANACRSSWTPASSSTSSASVLNASGSKGTV